MGKWRTNLRLDVFLNRQQYCKDITLSALSLEILD